jgi:hypothetical protein
VGVTTNGTLPIDIDSDIVWVSIDGLKETHNRIRGDCFDRVVENIEITIGNAAPDGKITSGCYIKGRGSIACDKCGFAVHT